MPAMVGSAPVVGTVPVGEGLMPVVVVGRGVSGCARRSGTGARRLGSVATSGRGWCSPWLRRRCGGECPLWAARGWARGLGGLGDAEDGVAGGDFAEFVVGGFGVDAVEEHADF